MREAAAGPTTALAQHLGARRCPFLFTHVFSPAHGTAQGDRQGVESRSVFCKTKSERWMMLESRMRGDPIPSTPKTPTFL